MAVHNQQLNQKYQYYLNESQKLMEDLKEDRNYIDLLENIISEFLIVEDIEHLFEGEKRLKRIRAAFSKSNKKTAAARAAGVTPDGTSPESVALKAGEERQKDLYSARHRAEQKLRRRVSKEIAKPGSIQSMEGGDSLPNTENPHDGSFLSLARSLVLPRKELARKDYKASVERAAHRDAVDQAIKDRINPDSTTSGSNATKTAAKALQGGASHRDAESLVQRTTRTLTGASVANAEYLSNHMDNWNPNNPRNKTKVGSKPTMPQQAATRIVKNAARRLGR
jgi:hypothetical protein